MELQGKPENQAAPDRMASRQHRIARQKSRRESQFKGELKRFVSRREKLSNDGSDVNQEGQSKENKRHSDSQHMKEARKIRDNLTIHKLRQMNMTALALDIAAASLSRSSALPVAHTILNMVCERAKFDVAKDAKIKYLYKQEHVEEFFRSTDYKAFRVVAERYEQQLDFLMQRSELKKTKDLQRISDLAIINALDDTKALTDIRSSSDSYEQWYGAMLHVPGTKKVAACRVQKNHWEWPLEFKNIDKSHYQANFGVKLPTPKTDPTGKSFWVRDIGAGQGNGAFQFNAPTGIDVRTHGLEKEAGELAQIAIADTGNHRVQIVTLRSTFELHMAHGQSNSVVDADKLHSGKRPIADNDDKYGGEYVFDGLLGPYSLLFGRDRKQELNITKGRRMGLFTCPRIVSFGSKDSLKKDNIYVSDNSLSDIMGHPRIQEFSFPPSQNKASPCTLQGFIDNCSYPDMSLDRAMINPVHNVHATGSTHFVYTDCNGRPTQPLKRDRILVSAEKQKIIDSLTTEANASRSVTRELNLRAELQLKWKQKRYLYPKDWKKREKEELQKELKKLKRAENTEREANKKAQQVAKAAEASLIQKEVALNSDYFIDSDGKRRRSAKLFGSLDDQRLEIKKANAAILRRQTDSASESATHDEELHFNGKHASNHDKTNQDRNNRVKEDHGNYSTSQSSHKQRRAHSKSLIPDMVSGFAWSFPRAIRPLDLESSMLSCLGKFSEAGKESRNRVVQWFDVLNRDNDYQGVVYATREDRVKSLRHNNYKAKYAEGVEIEQCMATLMPSLLKMVMPETEYNQYITNYRTFQLAGDIPEHLFDSKGQQNIVQKRPTLSVRRLTKRFSNENQNSFAESFYEPHPLRIVWTPVIRNLQEDLREACTRENLPRHYIAQIEAISNDLGELPPFKKPLEREMKPKIEYSSRNKQKQAKSPNHGRVLRESARRDWNLEVQHKLVNLACLARFVRDMQAVSKVKQLMREKRQRIDNSETVLLNKKMLDTKELLIRDSKSAKHDKEHSENRYDNRKFVPGSGRHVSGVLKGHVSTTGLLSLQSDNESKSDHVSIDDALKEIFLINMESKVKEMISEIMYEKFNNYLRVYERLEDTYLFQSSDPGLRQAADEPISAGVTTAGKATSAILNKYKNLGWEIRRDVIKRNNNLQLREDSQVVKIKTSVGSSKVSKPTSNGTEEDWWCKDEYGADTFTLTELPRSSIRGTPMQAYVTSDPKNVGVWVDGTVVGLDREHGLYIFEHQNKSISLLMQKMSMDKSRSNNKKKNSNKGATNIKPVTRTTNDAKEMRKLSSEFDMSSSFGVRSEEQEDADAPSTEGMKLQQVLLVARSHLREKPPEANPLFSKPWGIAHTESKPNSFIAVSDYDLGCIHFFDSALVDKDDIALLNKIDMQASQTTSDSANANSYDFSEVSYNAMRDSQGKPDMQSNGNTTFDRKSPYLYTIGIKGKLRGQLRGPKGICFDASNRLIVADSLNDRIQCFEYVAQARGGASDVSLHPSIGNHQGNGRWVCSFVYPENGHTDDATTDKYMEFAGHSSAISHVDHATKGQPKLCHPSDVCVDSFGNILVADTGNSCIRVLRTRTYYGPHYPVEPSFVDSSEEWMFEKTLKGQYIRSWPYSYLECIATWGCRGFLQGQLIRPVAITSYTLPSKHTPQARQQNIHVKHSAKPDRDAMQKNSHRKSKAKSTLEHDGIDQHVEYVKFVEQRYLVVDQGKNCVTEFSVTPPDFQWNARETLSNISTRDFAEPNLGNLGLPGSTRRKAMEARNEDENRRKKKKKKKKNIL